VKRYTVKQGETMLSIAAAHEIVDWKRIWEHADNQALRDKRTNPQVLLPGDVVVIPDDREKEHTVPSGRSQKFVLTKATCFFSTYLLDECGEPYANLRYQLRVGNQTFEGRTSGEGLVAHACEPTARTGELKLWRKDDDAADVATWRLDIGGLNPVGTLSGVKARLRNLGYQVGSLDENLDATTRTALRSFRQHVGLDSTKDGVDDELRDELLKQQRDF
jgi:N-acetylmuramoyl-L-alanine amidase